MATRGRPVFYDVTPPGYRILSGWIAKPYAIAAIAVGLFAVILGFTIFLGYRQFETARYNALTTDKATANLLADLILERNRATIGILQSYAHRPLFIDAVKNRDLAGVNRHLTDLKKNAEIDLTFVTDKAGILWANFPSFPEAMGTNLSHRDWYKGISAHWKPYISTVFKLMVGEKPLAAAVCVPIFDEKQRVIGVLASSQRLSFINDLIEQVTFTPSPTVNVIDRAGKIIYSNSLPYLESIADYPFFSFVEPALKGKKQQIELTDPQRDQNKRYLTVASIGDIGWSITIERSLRDIYRSEFRRFIETGTISLLLFLLIISFLVYLRRTLLFRKTEELLQTEIKLRQEEEKLRALSSRQEALLAAVPEIIMEVDNNKVYTWANSLGIEFFGEEVIGKEAAFYFEGEQEIYDTVRPLFNGVEDIVYLESWQRRKDGEKRLLAWWCRALKDESGQVTGALSSARDITDRRQAEEEIRMLNEKLEQRVIDRTIQLEAANKEMEAFAYSVSHDLRTPLRSIDGFSMALLEDYQDKPLDDTGKNYLERVRMATKHMGRLIDDMLKLSTITRLELKREAVDLSGIIREITEEHRKGNPGRAADAIVQEGITVQGDPYLLKIAMKNLMDNAWKFTGNTKHPRIEFGTTARDGKTVFFIRDNGAGFEMAYAGKLFGAFQRLHTTAEFPGTGIGLATVQRIIHRHGGQIWAEGEKGKGATFSFTLP
jgi:PAS domain S-box-containing protein